MINYLIKLFILTLFSFIIIYFYYSWNKAHVENFDWYLSYILIVWVIYAIYKYIQTTFSLWLRTYFTPFKIISFFLLHLFILSFLFFSLNWEFFWWWIVLFFNIIFYLILPVTIVFISTWLWKKIISYIPNLEKQSSEFNLITSIWIGFFSFLFLVAVFWFLWFYNLYLIFIILIWFIIFSYKELWELINWFFCSKIEFDISEWYYIKLITAELLFLISTLVISTNLINIIRPFPIWWDDLWAYMNMPHLFAEIGGLTSTWGMFSWQTFTWIWYMFNSPVQAFFLNNVGWILSFILLILITSDFLNNNNIHFSNGIPNKEDVGIITKSYISIPILIATIFISMPVIIFQQAKDMKLDTWLFFVSIISIYVLYKYIESKSKLNKKKWWIYFLLIIWILAWFAFTIKVTSLMLILWIIGVLFYKRLWLAGFFWYLSIFFAIFTKFHLWDKLNIIYPKEDLFLINSFSLTTLIIWLWFLIYTFLKDKINIKRVFIELWILILWILIAIFPWMAKNIYTSYPDVSISAFIWWKSEHFEIDYSKIYSETELEVKKNSIITGKMTSLGTTDNEDVWRYFWYQEWINNYIKLPWNLTMQLNQWGEFTDIWFIFLALLPALLLFLPYKKSYYSYAVLFLLFLELLIFVIPWTIEFFTKIMSNILLPWWYIFILASFMLPLIYFSYLLKNTSKTELFKINMVFGSFYTFLWVISAFWIIWYGIVMFFSFLLMIAIWIYYISSYIHKDSIKIKQIKLFWSIAIILIISTYFLNSVYPHTFNNLKNASYKEYKLWKITTEESPFLYHKEYLPILFELNIKPEKRIDFFKKNISESIKNNFNIISNDVNKVTRSLKELELAEHKKPNNEAEAKIFEYIKKEKIYNDAKISLQKIYSGILNPEDEFKNNIWIYRIWTFLKYFISDNNIRLLEDSLITIFDNYIYNPDDLVTIENMKKIWVWYFLVDLNAATIDQDPRHALTVRYEKLLKTFTSDKLELVDTDSICLKVALDDYNKSNKTEDDMNKYIKIWGVNYESYLESWKVVNRKEKLFSCYIYILDLMKKNKIDQNNYEYLLRHKIAIDNNRDKFNEDKDIIFFLKDSVNHWFKALFKIK